MYDDDMDALAAEYVLGTLSADERSQARALIRDDADFEEIVRQWERRLGELNVMVEAAEPPPEIWDRIKSEVGAMTAADDPAAEDQSANKAAGEADAKAEEDSPILAALASRLIGSEHEAAADPASAPAAKSDSKAASEAPAQPRPPASVEPAPALRARETVRTPDVALLARRVRRWRVATLACAVLALLLAVGIAVTQVAPELIPAGGWRIPRLFALPSAGPTAAPGRQLVAVLQQDPTQPAFLLTIDAANLTMTVRRLVAPTDPAHAYELWLVSPEDAKPRSLGTVGAKEFTQRPLPGRFDLETVRTATYEISFEAAGGSTAGAPAGPVLFRGKIVEAVPESLARS